MAPDRGPRREEHAERNGGDEERPVGDDERHTEQDAEAQHDRVRGASLAIFNWTSAIHLGAGFKEQERPHVLETLEALGAHLKRWNPDEVDVEVSVQDRGGKEQRVTLRTTVPGLPPLVAVADGRDLTRALGEAKRELIRQIDHHKSAREPMNSRQLRSETIRHPKQLGESP